MFGKYRWQGINRDRRMHMLSQQETPEVPAQDEQALFAGGLFEVSKVMPKAIAEYLQANGQQRIAKMEVCRVPIPSAISFLGNLLTLGQYNDAMKQYGYDSFFHLYLIATFDNGSVLSIEKNQRAQLGGNPNREGAMCLPVMTYVPDSLTLQELFDHAIAQLPEQRLWYYDAISQNCQRFVEDLLWCSGLLNSRLRMFIEQNVGAAIKEGGWTHNILSFGTDLANRFKTFISGGAEKDE